MLPVASPTNCRKSCPFADEGYTFQNDLHNKDRTICRPVFYNSFKIHREAKMGSGGSEPAAPGGRNRQAEHRESQGAMEHRDYASSPDQGPEQGSRRQPRTSPVTSSRTCESARARPACRLRRPARSDAARAGPSPPRARRSPWAGIRRSCPIESSHAPSRVP